MASWRMNNCFAPLNAKLRERFPRITIYGIGDLAHRTTKSDHNPNKYGRVNAEDFMIRNGFDRSDAVWLCAWLIQDSRTKYVIYNRRIWESDTGKWSTYNGDNPHTDHVHLSVFDSADNNDRPWTLENRKIEYMDLSVSLPILQQGDDDARIGGYNLIARIQKITGAEPDGIWGPATTAAIAKWMGRPESQCRKMNESLWRNLLGLSKSE